MQEDPSEIRINSGFNHQHLITSDWAAPLNCFVPLFSTTHVPNPTRRSTSDSSTPPLSVATSTSASVSVSGVTAATRQPPSHKRPAEEEAMGSDSAMDVDTVPALAEATAKPFALVDEVAEGSPAATAGVEVRLVRLSKTCGIKAQGCCHHALDPKKLTP